MTKTCSTCKKDVSIDLFGLHSRSKSGYRCECKNCRSIKSKTKRAEYGKVIAEIKTENPCMDCGIRYPSPVMQFDHVRGEKEFDIAYGVSCTYNWDKLLNEIAKCDIICSNCHAIRTWTRG